MRATLGSSGHLNNDSNSRVYVAPADCPSSAQTPWRGVTLESSPGAFEVDASVSSFRAPGKSRFPTQYLFHFIRLLIPMSPAGLRLRARRAVCSLGTEHMFSRHRLL